MNTFETKPLTFEQMEETDLLNIVKRIEQGSLTALRNGSISKAEKLIKLHDSLKEQLETKLKNDDYHEA